MSGLKPCPFCGHDGVHLRKKTDMRQSVTGLKYMHSEDVLHPLYYGFIGTEQTERECYDYRFGVRYYCGRCGISPRYVWGEWHLPTEDEAEEFDALPHACDRFDEEQERESIEKARELWNRRA